MKNDFLFLQPTLRQDYLFRRLPYLLNNPPLVSYAAGSTASTVTTSSGLSAPLPINVHLSTLQERFRVNATTENVHWSFEDGHAKKHHYRSARKLIDVMQDAVRVAEGADKRRISERRVSAASAVELLVRVTHVYGPGEEPSLTADAKIDLAAVLSELGTIESIEERTLTGVFPTSRYQDRPAWNHDGSVQKPYGGLRQPAFSPGPPTVPLDGTTVTLTSMDIRTFLVKLVPSSRKTTAATSKAAAAMATSHTPHVRSKTTVVVGN